MPLFRNKLLVMIRTPNPIISCRGDEQQTNDGGEDERADKIPQKPKRSVYTQYCDQQAEHHVYEKEYHQTYAPLGRPKRQSTFGAQRSAFGGVANRRWRARLRPSAVVFVPQSNSSSYSDFLRLEVMAIAERGSPFTVHRSPTLGRSLKTHLLSLFVSSVSSVSSVRCLSPAFLLEVCRLASIEEALESTHHLMQAEHALDKDRPKSRIIRG
jgi:hypothetical protein